ncbi:hypothetical protein WJX72_003511 [[Myrmecia] bisecta]|uniref:U-box domain-containing protein n=1 Tax=[Myrmecia] bisecta TaxID=41462 RepID=A0AAW1Q3L4_9CHLO
MQFCKRLWQVVLLSAVLLPCFTILSPSSPGLATSFQGVSFLAYVPYVGPAFRLARQAVTGPHPWQLFKPFPSHAGLPTEGAEPYAGTNTTSYALPADVRNWSCLDVQHWLQRQNWNWRELNRYAEATCKVGVSEDVLEFDFEIRYRLHRRVILEAIRSLQQEQPNGIHYPRDLREYRKEFPTKASVYFSGILSAPRTCLLWLHVFDGDLLKRVRHGANFSGGLADTVAAPAPLPGSTADGRPGPPASLHWLDTNWFFLVSWWLWPGLLVAWHAMRFFHLHPFVVSYVVAVGLARTATEMYSLYMALVHTGINPGEVFSSLVCSHMLTPLINLVLAGCTVATAPLAPLLPQWIIFLIFWGRCVLLPLLTLWADFASWMPNGAELGGNPTRRRPRRGEEGLVHWPPPLEVPEELEEAGDVPDSFRCPITLCIMREPAQTPAGLTYERTAIARWLHAHHSDPSTKMPLRRRHLAPNLSMRCVIDSWVKEASKSRGLKLSNTDPPAAPEQSSKSDTSSTRADK